jgi:hypothetical protein
MFKLKADPTFVAKVELPVSGRKSVKVALIFKHRTKDELNEWLKGSKTRSDEDTFMEMVAGWVSDEAEAKSHEAEPFAEEFSLENVKVLLQHRIGVALASYQVYIDELTRHREKN